MGRPIKKTWFGDPNSVGYQLKITAKLEGSAAAEGFIVEQTGTRKYKVNIGGEIGDVFLVNKDSSGDLEDGEGFMTAETFGGDTEVIYKLTQYRVSTWKADGSFGNYKWSAEAASNDGEATVVTDDVVDPEDVKVQATATSSFAVVSGGTVTGVTVTAGGSGYTSAPTVTFTGGGGTGAAGTAVLTADAVTSVTITNAGTGYTSAPTVAFTGGAGTGAAGTSAVSAQVKGVTAVSVTNQGNGYTSVPAVTFTGGGGTGAAATAVLTGGKVTTVNVTAAGSGYTSAPTVTIAAP